VPPDQELAQPLTLMHCMLLIVRMLIRSIVASSKTSLKRCSVRGEVLTCLLKAARSVDA
jgi:hypothetical protein